MIRTSEELRAPKNARKLDDTDRFGSGVASDGNAAAVSGSKALTWPEIVESGTGVDNFSWGDGLPCKEFGIKKF